MTAITPSETKAVSSMGRLRGYHSGARELDDAAVEVRGELPPWLRGGLLLNGPALWDLPGR
jgi:beta,beta-carotene 9',10'-dioxygenase